MAGNIILYPFSIRKKAPDMSSKLESVEAVISDTQSAYTDVENESKLNGKSWNSVKNYIRDIQQPYLVAYKAWKSEQIEALEIYKNAGLNLPDVQKLDKSQMENTIERSRRTIRRERRREHPNYSTIEFYENLIDELTEKIKAMDVFIAAISGIFDKADSMHSTIVGAKEALDKVKLSEKGDEIEYTEVMKGDNIKAVRVMAGMYIIYSAGVKKEEIECLYELGLIDEDIALAYLDSKAEGDGDFIINFIKKDYKKAFESIEGDYIGNTSALFILTYFSGIDILKSGAEENSQVGMEEFSTDTKELNETKMKELESMMNAILDIRNADGHIDRKKVINNLAKLTAVSEVTMRNTVLYALSKGEDINEKIYEGIVNEDNNLMALTLLFASNIHIMDDQTQGYNTVQLDSIKIKNLCFDGKPGIGGYKFDISYDGYGIKNVDIKEHKIERIDLEDTIETDIVRDGESLRKLINSENTKRINEAREELLSEVYGNTAMDLGILAAKDVPMLGSTISLTRALTNLEANNIYSEVKDISEEASDLLGKELPFDDENLRGIEGITIITDSVTGYIEDAETLEQSYKDIVDADEAELFGRGGTYKYCSKDEPSTLVAYGRYSPEKARTIAKIEKEGLVGLLGLEREYDNTNSIIKTEFENEIGGKDSEKYKIFSGGADIWNMPVEEYNANLTGIYEKYQSKINSNIYLGKEYNKYIGRMNE